MPRFLYTARDETGRATRGLCEAANKSLLYARLRANGTFLVRCFALPLPPHRLGTARLAGFCRGLSTLLCAGVPVAQALTVLAAEPGLTRSQRRVYDALLAEVQQGNPLSQAMENRGGVFPTLLIATLRSGEGNGTMGKNAARMATHYEQEHFLEQQTANSFTYPAVLAGLLVLVVVFFMQVLLPRFQTMFAALPTLPLPTALLLGAHNFAQAHGPLLVFWAALGALLVAAVLRLPSVQMSLARCRLALPFTGKMHRCLCTARFARTLSGLYGGGAPIVSALQAGQETVGNCYIARQFERVIARVQAGCALSAALGAVDGFEPRLAAALLVGEETGRLGELLRALSAELDGEASAAARRLAALAEPALILIMAAAVAFVMLAVLLPLYQSYGVLGRGV
ncbi:MAG: type II secretion system F family protein [Gemmiger sp.]|nr:type II secretion system F family protein [Gemmiger sp.]